ncbi:dTDP-4-amino-4,6-dideoxygalactose transaminase [Anseongella ginsenosidimutans]|uniref:dTDP-4-amino-4,6-dideoxygalactose transaminase n=1 Tax=Anseongella ginsenosidimutans TaxID=496056 RepID=A0A4R3KQW6_9SPHI|nr:DegT/DnrJ/EryC1/StrS family aminotransferase [Anseongella ginsenosidimutans]QEC52198.1 DegT/DnrJ/EryC1/StrS family aminotransferase [Anseongella ginsenosidimutans]TCS86743.1 dTDP-4-amino-4,6-dideoxygalactose transaminase [Anseongella ginsenosidimutans]
MKRRNFLKQGALAGAGAAVTISGGALLSAGLASPMPASPPPAGIAGEIAKPAILGGRPVLSGNWPGWPIWNPETDEKRIIEVLRSGRWSRSEVVSEFEEKWAAAVGAKRCLAVVNGTNALIASLVQLGIGGGDEVIVPPYTFIATVAAVLATGAMPVFADTDPETFQIDTRKIEAKITSRTRAILPVHILGLPADMGRIMEIASKHDLVVVEDACQAWLAEINGKKAGTFGHAGCFSFQNSKNLPIGEGGAIVSDDEEFMDRCYSYHNYGMPYGTLVGAVGAGSIMAGTKLRLTEYQAAIGLAQLERLEGQTARRNENAGYLKKQIQDIPGITPYKLYDNVTRAAFHLFAFRYRKEAFKGLPRAGFLKALRAEGVPCSSGYATLNNQPYLAQAFQTKNFRKMYPEEMLDIDLYLERNQCPENDRLCNEEAVWIPQNVLLGTAADMGDIALAIEKIHKNADRIQK